MARPNIDEVRARLIDAGATVLKRRFESAQASSAISALDLKEVAAEAGYSSPGMIYTAWTDQVEGMSPREGYTHDLAMHMIDIATNAEELIAQMVEAVEDLSADGGLNEIVKSIANASFRVAYDESAATAYAALASLGRGTDAYARFVELEQASIVETADVYNVALEALGRKYRPGIDGNTLSLLLRSIEHGLGAALTVTPDLIEHDAMTWRGSGDWTLSAIVAIELFESLTEPIE